LSSSCEEWGKGALGAGSGRGRGGGGGGGGHQQQEGCGDLSFYASTQSACKPASVMELVDADLEKFAPRRQRRPQDVLFPKSSAHRGGGRAYGSDGGYGGGYGHGGLGGQVSRGNRYSNSGGDTIGEVFGGGGGGGGVGGDLAYSGGCGSGGGEWSSSSSYLSSASPSSSMLDPGYSFGSRPEGSTSRGNTSSVAPWVADSSVASPLDAPRMNGMTLSPTATAGLRALHGGGSSAGTPPRLRSPLFH
jgi:hypothetical protein